MQKLSLRVETFPFASKKRSLKALISIGPALRENKSLHSFLLGHWHAFLTVLQLKSEASEIEEFDNMNSLYTASDIFPDNTDIFDS